MNSVNSKIERADALYNSGFNQTWLYGNTLTCLFLHILHIKKKYFHKMCKYRHVPHIARR